jgi:hypothetical protein
MGFFRSYFWGVLWVNFWGILDAAQTPSRPTQTTGVGLTERPTVFLVVGKTSALTLNVAGVVKDWLLIGFSWSVIKDTMTAVNLVGYLLAFMGVVYYNHSKFEGASGNGGAEEGAAHANRWGVWRATPWPRGGSPGTPDCVGMEEEGPEVADEPPLGWRGPPHGQGVARRPPWVAAAPSHGASNFIFILKKQLN